jgi:hypothetical protein
MKGGASAIAPGTGVLTGAPGTAPGQMNK